MVFAVRSVSGNPPCGPPRLSAACPSGCLLLCRRISCSYSSIVLSNSAKISSAAALSRCFTSALSTSAFDIFPAVSRTRRCRAEPSRAGLRLRGEGSEDEVAGSTDTCPLTSPGPNPDLTCASLLGRNTPSLPNPNRKPDCC